MGRTGENVVSEEVISQKATEFMKFTDKPIFVVQSSTNIDRIDAMYKAALHSNRLFVMDIFTANIVYQLTDTIPKPGKLNNVRVIYPKGLTKLMFAKPQSVTLIYKFTRYKVRTDYLSAKMNYCMIIRSSMLEVLESLNVRSIFIC